MVKKIERGFRILSAEKRSEIAKKGVQAQKIQQTYISARRTKLLKTYPVFYKMIESIDIDYRGFVV